MKRDWLSTGPQSPLSFPRMWTLSWRVTQISLSSPRFAVGLYLPLSVCVLLCQLLCDSLCPYLHRIARFQTTSPFRLMTSSSPPWARIAWSGSFASRPASCTASMTNPCRLPQRCNRLVFFWPVFSSYLIRCLWTQKKHSKNNPPLQWPQGGTAFVTLDEMEFNRRMAIEKELEKSESKSLANVGQCFFPAFFFLLLLFVFPAHSPRLDSLRHHSVWRQQQLHHLRDLIGSERWRLHVHLLESWTLALIVLSPLRLQWLTRRRTKWLVSLGRPKATSASSTSPCSKASRRQRLSSPL